MKNNQLDDKYIEKRGVVSNVRYQQKADTHSKIQMTKYKDIETSFSYNISFSIENMIFTYDTKYEHFINDGDEIIVNATPKENGVHEINFYRNFTTNTNNFDIFFKEYFGNLSLSIISLVGILYIIFSGSLLELFDAPMFAIVIFIFALLVALYPFFMLPTYNKLEKRIEHFKTLS